MTLCKDADRGQFKTAQNTLTFEQNGMEIGTLETTPPEDTSILIQKLLEWTHKNLHQKTSHPLLIIGLFTAIFLQIAPFTNHNRKLVILLINVLMLKSGYRYVPFASLDESMEARTFQMYEALIDHQNSLEAGAPEWSAWIKCFLDILIDQKNTLLATLGQNTNTISEMPALSIAIMDVVAAQKRTTMRDIMRQTKGRRSTIKLRLQELIDKNYIKRHGAGRSVWYSLV
jgi:Fic family protein